MQSATGFGKPSKGDPMTTRLPASQRTREELSALIEGRLCTVSAKDELVKLATRLIVEEALEGEAGDAVGRDYYEHGAHPGQGYRNGYRMGRLKTAEGAMDIRHRRSRGGMSRSARLFASISRVIRRDWRIWRSRCWRVGYRCAISKMHSRTRMVGCCYRRPPCRSLGNDVGGLPGVRPARFERV